MLDPFQLSFVQRGLVEVLLLSVGAGLLGSWIVLRGLAFYSHAVAASSFPGLVLAGGLGFAAPLGAFGAGLVFAGGVAALARGRRGSDDSQTAIVLTGALALGVILASDVFHSGSNIETLLFGSLLAIDMGDVALAAAASAVMAGATLLLGQAWLASGFDPGAARALGMRSLAPDAVLLVLIALVVAATLSAVGSLLAASLIVVPAATVRLWTRRMASWQVGAIALTAAEGTAALWLSVKTNAPPGATLAVIGGGVFALAATLRALAAARLPRLMAGVAACLAAALAVAACGSSDSSGKLEVVATTTQIGDWVRAVGGDAVDTHQILRANTDPHDYEPRPRDVEATTGARLVFKNGDRLDDWMDELVDDAGGSPTVVDLGERLPVKLPGESSGPENDEAAKYDGHWWHDPRNAESAVATIARALADADGVHRRTYAHNASAYLAKLRRLDAAIGKCFAAVPRSTRKLVTDHDAFAYFARRYGIDVVGTVIPSQTTQAQPSARDVSRLVGLIEREHVRAIFPESSISPKLAEAIANRTGADASFTLYGDTLGSEGSSGGTYLASEAENADSMVRGFTSSGRGCRAAVR
jgi:zinc/manganese transport system substrate-binding protein